MEAHFDHLFFGHAAPGLFLLVLGFWGLLNNIRSYAQSPLKFRCRPWFPVESEGPIRHVELFFVLAAATAGFIIGLPGYGNHKVVVHITILCFFILYSAVAILTSRAGIHTPRGFLYTLQALAQTQIVLFFSSGHSGPGLEQHYHRLLSTIGLANLLATLAEAIASTNLTAALIRHASIILEGCWFCQIGLALTLPSLLPQGCGIFSLGQRIRCRDQSALDSAKTLASLAFSWYLLSLAAIVSALYIFLAAKHKPQEHHYESIQEEQL